MSRPALLLALLIATAGPSAATTIDIQFTNLDLSYDGSTVTEDGDGDTLSSITIDEDGVNVAAFNGGTIDLEIPGVTGIDVAGGVAVSDDMGWMLLTLPTGDTVELNLSNVTVNYVDAGAFGGFVFGGTIAQIQSQSLPNGLELDDAATVSFSASLVSSDDDGTHLTSFKASGTGQVSGSLLVPEPTAAAAAGLMFLVAAGAALMRAKLG